MKNRNSLLLLILTLITSQTLAQEQSKKKIKLYSFYTPSHKILKDEWFLPSIQDDYDVTIEFHEQECPSGNFAEKGWITVMLRKVDLILKGIEENWGNIFVYADIDIQFFGPTQKSILKALENNDIVVQKDQPNGMICAGFFACKANDKMLALWEKIKETMIKDHQRDQPTLNRFLKKDNMYNIQWDYLPVEFFGAGTLTGKSWKPGKKLTIPKNTLMHHANFTKGVHNKLAQLKYVRDIVQSQ